MTNNIAIFNAETNTIDERPMTSAELAEYRATVAEATDRENAAIEAKNNAMSELTKLGLTEKTLELLGL